ncbi:unnamed protein product [Amoebophrya sp. A120]|nr:unnamed protein product [Amoebophrya sp. A120]|eukprot:GSA120T00009337001.1
MVKNSAFVFVKPHANTEKARVVVKEGLEAKGLKVLKEGLITGKEIDEKQLIDNHYYAIASKATILKPSELNVPKKMFTDKFGGDWDATLAEGKIFNAKDACTKLGMDSEQLNTEWAKAKKAGKLVKFGGGFYCGLIDTVEGQEPIYVMNGFFMSMRSNYVVESASLYYFVVEWDSKNLSWEEFRGQALGPTDPVTAPEDSLRGMFYKNWKEYGLESVPNVGDNAVHASASPFEALAEKMNWLGMKPEEDDFGKALLKILDTKTLVEWGRDAQVTYGPVSIKKSVFDSVEDTDAAQCLALLGMMYVQSDEKFFQETVDKLKELKMGA